VERSPHVSNPAVFADIQFLQMDAFLNNRSVSKSDSVVKGAKDTGQRFLHDSPLFQGKDSYAVQESATKI